MYKGVSVHCMCRWSKKRSITSEILVDIFAALDDLKVFEVDRAASILPFLLIDGHVSRFQLPFLRYIHDPLKKWVVVISVPYGTALWEVGDLSEQNGSFNMESVLAKR